MLVGGTVVGNVALQKAVAKHVSEWRGIEASPQQIIITAGSGDALELCIRTLTKGWGHDRPGRSRLFAASPFCFRAGTQSYVFEN